MKIACTFASFHVKGNLPRLSDLLNNFVKGETIKIAVSRNIFGGRLSGPHDLWMSRELRSFKTSRSVITILSNFGTMLLGGCISGAPLFPVLSLD